MQASPLRQQQQQMEQSPGLAGAGAYGSVYLQPGPDYASLSGGAAGSSTQDAASVYHSQGLPGFGGLSPAVVGFQRSRLVPQAMAVCGSCLAAAWSLSVLSVQAPSNHDLMSQQHAPPGFGMPMALPVPQQSPAPLHDAPQRRLVRSNTQSHPLALHRPRRFLPAEAGLFCITCTSQDWKKCTVA